MKHTLPKLMAVVILCAATLTPCAAQTDKSKTAAATNVNARLNDAKDDPKLAEFLLKTGQKVATFCANCHGQNGNSISPDIPNLAGQNPVYLLEQLRKFADGSRRNEFMQGMIKALNVDEKVGIVLYFSAQATKPRPVTNAVLAAKGKDIFNKNCFRCHGANGLGGEKFARLAGQQPGYLKMTLLNYRAGSGLRMDPLMAANTKLLTDNDVDAVVSYVSSM